MFSIFFPDWELKTNQNQPKTQQNQTKQTKIPNKPNSQKTTKLNQLKRKKSLDMSKRHLNESEEL